ncbi:MAG: molybdopterin-dependent oxidoreductase, partial [Eggerthellaceae bacterium]
EKFVGFFSDSFAEDVKAAEPTDASMFMGVDPSGTLTVEDDMSYEAYLKGTGAYEGTGEKTPEWAAAITGVSAENIRMLADVFVNGPTAAIQGWGPQRHSNGGNSARAIGLIAAITGNAGISGGGTGAREATRRRVVQDAFRHSRLPREKHRRAGHFFLRVVPRHRRLQVDDRCDVGPAPRRRGGQRRPCFEPGEISLKAPIKFIWNYASNVMMGQHADINDCLRIYNLPDEKDSVRCIVTCDVYMTPTAMVSDYILPGTTSFEEIDVTKGGSAWTGFVMCETRRSSPCSNRSRCMRPAPCSPSSSA